MEFDLANSIALLSRTPSALNALLRDLPDAWTSKNEGDGTMTTFDVVGHLTHLERTDWMRRVTLVLQCDESLVFPRVDRWGHVRECQGKTLQDLLDEFDRLRSQNLNTLRSMNLQPDDFSKRTRHPSFGPVTLAQLLATWTAHDMTHLHQISRILAHQYREAVGPWIKFLGVLQCDGHSMSA
jgi:hypothetical protein